MRNLLVDKAHYLLGTPRIKFQFFNCFIDSHRFQVTETTSSNNIIFVVLSASDLHVTYNSCSTCLIAYLTVKYCIIGKLTVWPYICMTHVTKINNFWCSLKVLEQNSKYFCIICMFLIVYRMTIKFWV